MLTPLGSLLAGRTPSSTGRAVSRALFLLQTTVLVQHAYPQWGKGVRCQAVVGDALILACSSSLLLHEVRKHAANLLQMIQKENGGIPITRLQCLLSQGTVAADEIPV